MRAQIPGGRTEGGPHQFKPTVYRYLLQLLADQSRRVPFPVLGLLIVLALIASQRMPVWIPALWVLFAMGVLALRWRWLGLLPRRDDLSLQARLRLAVALSLLNGLAHGASLAAFPVLTEAERAFFTVLLLGLCTGAVGTTAGHRSLFIAYTLPVLIPLTALWAWSPQAANPSWVERSVAVLIGLYFWIALGLAREAWKRFLESVRIRYHERSLNLKLQGALLHANEANLAKTRFLAAASHDLRQPLHTIGLLVAALSLRPANQRDKEIIELLGQVTVALSAQLDGLLDISKLDAGVVFAENKVFNLDELLRQHHAELDATAHAQGLQAELKSTANVFVETDPNLFLRVLRNLTDNALKFTESGFVGLELTTVGGRAVIVVRDSGMGIPHELQAQVFEEFYQVHNPERDRSKGLGLGLSIVRRLAHLLGIEVTMESTPGAGTVFELRLPLARRPEPVAIQHHPVGRTLSRAERVGAGRRALRSLQHQAPARRDGLHVHGRRFHAGGAGTRAAAVPRPGPRGPAPARKRKRNRCDTSPARVMRRCSGIAYQRRHGARPAAGCPAGRHPAASQAGGTECAARGNAGGVE